MQPYVDRNQRAEALTPKKYNGSRGISENSNYLQSESVFNPYTPISNNKPPN
jgi:hypothetical protein